jgi:hypothetical protein
MKRLPFWPSAAEQWVNCQGAARVNFLAQKLPRMENPYAGEGTDAHVYQEALLTAPSADATEVSDKMKALVRKQFPNVPDESVALLEDIADEVYYWKTLGGYELIVERKFPITLAGTKQNPKIDILLINESSAIIIDLKWGSGQAVHVVENKQLLLYALAVAEYYPGRVYQVGIYQPRGIGDGLEKWIVTKDRLIDARIEFERAARAAQEKEVTYTPGRHCMWCAGRRFGLCPELQRLAIDVACEAADLNVTKAPKGSPYKWDLDIAEHADSPWWVLDAGDQINGLIKGVGERADYELRAGRSVPGWQLGEKEGKSTWLNPEEVPDVLSEILGGSETEYTRIKKTPITITDARRLAKKKGRDIEELTHKPKSFVRVRATGPAVEPVE